MLESHNSLTAAKIQLLQLVLDTNWGMLLSENKADSLARKPLQDFSTHTPSLSQRTRFLLLSL